MKSTRLALSVPADVDSILDRLSVCLSTPKSRIIVELLSDVAPALEQTVIALERIQRDKDNALAVAKDYAQDALLSSSKKLGNLAVEIEKMK